MRKICGIYKITNNINGMEYCGQSQNCRRRWWDHCSSYTNDMFIDQAINEYGKENFTFKIEKECLPEELDFYEQETIKKYNTMWPNGYNRYTGGKDGFYLCEDARRSRSESQKGIIKTEEHRKKLSESMKGRIPWNKDKVMSDEFRIKLSESMKGKMAGEKNPMYNHKHTEETKRKISEKNKNRPHPKYKWITPSGEIREMCVNTAKQHHPDWIKIEE